VLTNVVSAEAAAVFLENPNSINRRTTLTTLYENGVGVLIWLACAALLFGALYACHLVAGEEALLPPGWFCDTGLGPGDRGNCYPAEGYHFEERGGGRIAVHDIATPALRQRDLDTADAWHLLTNEQRQQILDHKAIIYDFVERAK
jgi:hypothetical protein